MKFSAHRTSANSEKALPQELSNEFEPVQDIYIEIATARSCSPMAARPLGSAPALRWLSRATGMRLLVIVAIAATAAFLFDQEYNDGHLWHSALVMLRQIGHFIRMALEPLQSALRGMNSWQRKCDEPIPLPNGRTLVTLREAGDYIVSLPRSEKSRVQVQAVGHQKQ